MVGAVLLIMTEPNRITAEQNCNTKDYSSFVNQIQVETETSKEIKRQLEIYKGAMSQALQAGDAISYNKINELYNELLIKYAQSNNYETRYDYSKAHQAKQDCLDAVQKQKDTSIVIDIGILVFGLVVASIGIIIIIFKKKSSKTTKRPKKR